MSKKAKQIAALAANGLIIVFEIIGLVISIMGQGLEMFQYYTQDSNYLALAASLCYEFYAIMRLINGKAIPQWVSVIRYIATCCLMLTFSVVLFVLIPMAGIESAGFMLFYSTMLYHHFLCPVIAALSFLFFEDENRIGGKFIMIAMIPTFIYAAVTIVLNIINVLHGPYPFLYVHEQSWYMSVIWACVILGIALLFAWLLWFIKSKIRRKPEQI